jgi:hypothetical protein
MGLFGDSRNVEEVVVGVCGRRENATQCESELDSAIRAMMKFCFTQKTWIKAIGKLQVLTSQLKSRIHKR